MAGVSDAMGAVGSSTGLLKRVVHDDDFFLTTEGGDTTSVKDDPVSGTAASRDGGGLWRLRFADVSDPAKAMMLTLLLDGSEAPFLSKPADTTSTSRDT